MRPADTTPEAWKVMIEMYRRLSPAQRLKKALDLTAFSRLLLEAGVRESLATSSEEEIRAEVLRRWLGEDDLYSRAYGPNRRGSS